MKSISLTVEGYFLETEMICYRGQTLLRMTAESCYMVIICAKLLLTIDIWIVCVKGGRNLLKNDRYIIVKVDDAQNTLS